MKGDARKAWHVAAYFVPVVVWMAAIYVLSDMPQLPHAPDALADLLLKKGLHALGYGVLAWLWRRALQASGVGAPSAWALGLTVAYACTDEWHQTFVAGREGRISDVAIDAVGAALATVWLRRGTVVRRDPGAALPIDHDQ